MQKPVCIDNAPLGRRSPPGEDHCPVGLRARSDIASRAGNGGVAPMAAVNDLEDGTHAATPPHFWKLALGSVGVVYGDIGTSPLYALREALHQASRDGILGESEVIGIVSLLLWTLILIVTLKYVVLMLRADNRGEGGTLSLLALAQRAVGRRTPCSWDWGSQGPRSSTATPRSRRRSRSCRRSRASSWSLQSWTPTSCRSRWGSCSRFSGCRAVARNAWRRTSVR